MKRFSNFFKKEQPENNLLEINIAEDSISINKQLFTFPILVSDLNNLFGKPRVNINSNIQTWDDLGIHVHANDGIHITELDIQLIKNKDWDFLPKNVFKGKLTIEGENYSKAIKIDRKDYGLKDLIIGKTEVCAQLTNDDTKQIFLLSIYETEETKTSQPDKYNYQKITGEKIEFNDFNFKLLIIEELMYNRDLLKPKFDVHEFLKYQNRKINIDEEGYKLIPEVTEYFEKLEIDKKFANYITQIYQDGGNEIYAQICPFWNGEDNIFDIKSYEDTDQFTNLKKMTLMCSDDKILKELKKKGIDAETL